jgi:uncharacterized membrane protein
MAKKYLEKPTRSLVKAITYRIVIVTADTVIIYSFTHRWDFTMTVVLLANFTNTILYFLHERVWNGIHWGKYHRK